ncbi:IS66 family transposase [Candidatus Magnetobacterium casense]|uniref:IS66 family transposase n=1 Tax=Candidatus Magnetobacterium casense TaxID=1455061 RepID=UPI001C45B382|nr:IS66 family transposase [Candidatus Magnetobacterium casensis]
MSRTKQEAPKQIDLTKEQIEKLLQRIDEQTLNESDWEIIKGMINTVKLLSQALLEKNISITRLKKMIFGAGTESKEKVLSQQEKKGEESLPSEDPLDTASDNPNPDPDGPDPDSHDSEGKDGCPGQKKKLKGHGRNGACLYQGAKKVFVSHGDLKSGDLCPECEMGKVYCMKDPGVVVRVVGSAPLQATVYELEKLRCNLCGKVFTAKAPQEVGHEKYDATAGAMISVLKYGSGFPFYRLEGLQESLGIPLPASTQWEIVEAVANVARPVYDELFYQAAQGDIIHNDDTVMKILSLINNPAERQTDDDKDDSSRTGVFTTGILSIKDGHKIALFFTGIKHAGENMADLLKARQTGLPPPIQMCDALSRNVVKDLITLLANCLSHGRRKFVELISYFPEECRYVIEIIAKVYHYDSLAKEKEMSDEERLKFHQEHSGPLMEELKEWLKKQIEEKNVEPNSSLGKAFQYMLNHWGPLTLFLQVPGAPLDNNILERALKLAILHRKNALFYKTKHGAQVGDLLMSLIYTCRLAKVNPFDYFTALQKYSKHLSQNPQTWMPWNYQDTIASLNRSEANENQNENQTLLSTAG